MSKPNITKALIKRVTREARKAADKERWFRGFAFFGLCEWPKATENETSQEEFCKTRTTPEGLLIAKVTVMKCGLVTYLFSVAHYPTEEIRQPMIAATQFQYCKAMNIRLDAENEAYYTEQEALNAL